jgi:hypothetical protein
MLLLKVFGLCLQRRRGGRMLLIIVHQSRDICYIEHEPGYLANL